MELKPGNRAMTTRTVAATTLGLLLVGVAVVRAYGEQHNPSPDPYVFSRKQIVEFDGRVTHAQTGEGLRDVFVLVNMRSYKAVAYTHHGVSSCRESSQVVKTDAQGRYRVHWDWTNSKSGVPDDLSVNVKAYKPDWAHYPRAAKTGSSFLVSMQRDFQMLPSEQSLAERIDTLRRLTGDNCRNADHSPVGVEMAEAVYREAWNIWCVQASEPIRYEDFATVEVLLRGLKSKIAHGNDRNMTNDEAYERAQSHKRALLATLPKYPWPEGWNPPPVQPDFSTEEKQLLCQFLAPERLQGGRLP